MNNRLFNGIFLLFKFIHNVERGVTSQWLTIFLTILVVATPKGLRNNPIKGS